MRPERLMNADKVQLGDEFNAVTAYWENCIMHYPTIEKPAASAGDLAAALSGFTMAAPRVIGAPPSTVLVDGTIDGDEIDVYGVELVEGQTYLLTARGTGDDPLGDTFLWVFDDTLTPETLEESLITTDDDGGDGTNSLITYTATYTGVHYIGVSAFPGQGATGDFTLNAYTYPGVDLVEDDFVPSAPTLAKNATTFGFIDATGPQPYGASFSEVDTFKLDVEAGKVYIIEMAGGADYNSDWLALPEGEIDPRLALYTSEGDLVFSADDISFPSDISAGLGFIATASGTYYLDAYAWKEAWAGGFTLTVQEIDLSEFSPLDAIDWRSADNIDTVDVGGVPTAYVYFGAAGETFGEAGLVTYGWNATEKAAVMSALQEYTKILGIQYVETADVNQAEFRLNTVATGNFGAYFYPQDPQFGTQQGIGIFNVNSGGWDKPGVSTQDIPGNQVSLLKGGFAYGVILHEFGHAHGLAHPHDNGGGSEVLLGVTASVGSYGVYNLNQGVYTVMSYNDAWDFHPDGGSPFTIAGISQGWSGTLSAFDIAVLQRRYGTEDNPLYTPHATGNTTYTLKDVNGPGTYYETIWDTGGTDIIRYDGVKNATIDLLAATLDYSPTGGGALSFVNGPAANDGIWGGYTIANTVVIENAQSGGGNDVLRGNAIANILTGNGGDDWLMGKEGGDTLNGGGGFDTASYREATSGVTASLGSKKGTGGEAAGDKFNSIEKLEGSNFADRLESGSASDTLSGLGGDDRLIGGTGNDVLEGGDGDDDLEGGNGSDTMLGDAGADVLDGGNSSDTMNGGAGNDVLIGGNADDLLNGGADDDSLTGGNGDDVFAFTETGGDDAILDFRRGQDQIDLSGLDAIAGGGVDAFTWIGSSTFNGVSGQLRGTQQGGVFVLEGDVNGDAVADFTIEVNVAVTQADIIFA